MFDIANINEAISDVGILSQHYVLRNGFEFKPLVGPANVYDAIVIRVPSVTRASYAIPATEHTLEECIGFINEMKLEKAVIYADDISFIPQCRTLKYINIVPTYIGSGFDYSPLYEMPQIKALCCRTVYGAEEQYSSTVDYAKIKGIEFLGISGKGHLNFSSVQTLKSLSVSEYEHEDLQPLFCSKNLDSLSMMLCKIKTLDGIGDAPKMQCLYLDYNRSLKNISALCSVKSTLKALRIANCPKIEDFSVLEEMENLEFLELTGNNVLPSLHFIKKLKKLKTFVFSMNVRDGDLTPCLTLLHARSMRNRKCYNLKDIELPKGQYVRGTESIESWRSLE